MHLPGDNDVSVDTSDIHDIRKRLKEMVNLMTAPKEEPLFRFNVRRSYVFADFLQVCSRKWNKPKKSSKMVVTFIGEAGIDTGGPLK